MEDRIVITLLTRQRAEEIVGRELTDEEWEEIKSDLESDFSYLPCEVEPQIIQELERFREV